MNKLKVILVGFVCAYLSGCSSLNEYLEEKTFSLVLLTPKRCAVKLDSRKTYWSSFEGNYIYLYDSFTGEKCLLKTINHQPH